MGKLYRHYTDYSGLWPWADCSAREIACPCCGEMYLDAVAMDALQKLRAEWGKPVRINSGHRCAAHNKAVNGVADSMHLRAVAFDCHCPKAEQTAFVLAAIKSGFTGIGDSYKNFVHVDMGKSRRW